MLRNLVAKSPGVCAFLPVRLEYPLTDADGPDAEYGFTPACKPDHLPAGAGRYRPLPDFVGALEAQPGFKLERRKNVLIETIVIDHFDQHSAGN